VAVVLTLAAFIDYELGRFISSRKEKDNKILTEKPKTFTKGFIASMLHPNLLAFYFFNAGLKSKGLKQIIFVPLFMFPYGLLIAYTLSVFADQLRKSVETPVFILSILIIWFVISFWKENSSYLKS
jgi:hypothetical protein